MNELNALYWEYPYELVLALREAHPDADLDTLGLTQLFDWVIALPNFADDPVLVNDSILSDLLREWYEAQHG